MTSSFGVLKRKSAAGLPPGAAGLATLAGRLENAASHEHALEIRRGEVVAERGRVDVAELAQRECLRREREADVRVGELRPQSVAARKRDRAVVEREPGQAVDGMPVRVLRQRGIDPERHDPEVGGREVPLLGWRSGSLRVSSCSRCESSRTSTFAGEVPADRILERLAGVEVAAGRDQAPANGSLARCQRSTCSLPGAHLEDDGEGSASKWSGRLFHSFRL